MNDVVKFLRGKKTYLSAAAIFVLAICGWWFGAISEVDALALLALAFATIGLKAGSARYALATIQALEEIKAAQMSSASGQKIDIGAEVQKLTQIGQDAVLGAVVPHVVVNVHPPATAQSVTVFKGDSAK